MIDERMTLHRYKSTSHAGVACALMVVGWFAYQYYGKGVFRTDLAVIAVATAVIKLASLAWYRLRD
jgi:hypothetical protein